jgi:hypothetical protein
MCLSILSGSYFSPIADRHTSIWYFIGSAKAKNLSSWGDICREGNPYYTVFSFVNAKHCLGSTIWLTFKRLLDEYLTMCFCIFNFSIFFNWIFVFSIYIDLFYLGEWGLDCNNASYKVRQNLSDNYAIKKLKFGHNSIKIDTFKRK